MDKAEEILIRIKRLERKMVFSVFVIMTMLCVIAFMMSNDRMFAAAGLMLGLAGIIQVIINEVKAHKEDKTLRMFKEDIKSDN